MGNTRLWESEYICYIANRFAYPIPVMHRESKKEKVKIRETDEVLLMLFRLRNVRSARATLNNTKLWRDATTSAYNILARIYGER